LKTLKTAKSIAVRSKIRSSLRKLGHKGEI